VHAVHDGISAFLYGTLFACLCSGVRDRPVFDKERVVKEKLSKLQARVKPTRGRETPAFLFSAKRGFVRLGIMEPER
jgi:hypothetical protein